MNENAPAAESGQRQNRSNSGHDFTSSQTKKHRQIILEQIADRWSGRGYYPTPSRAMLALLEGVV